MCKTGALPPELTARDMVTVPAADDTHHYTKFDVALSIIKGGAKASHDRQTPKP